MTFKNIPVKLYYLCMYTNNGHVCVFLFQNEIYLIYFKARYSYLEKSAMNSVVIFGPSFHF